MKAIVQRRYGTVGRRGLASLPRFAGLIARTPFTKQLPPLDFATPGKPASMAELTELIEAGKLTPHVGRTFALEQAREALHHLASGQAAGKIILTATEWLTATLQLREYRLMSAECYWCSTGDEDTQNPPLGTCSDCWVFACEQHAERDANVGKWKCFDGVAKLLAAAAGLEDPEAVDDPPISEPHELALRFPRIAAQTEAERAHWSNRPDDLLRAVEQAAPDRLSTMLDRDPGMTLLGHAVGIARHFLRGPSIDAAGEGPRMSGRLGRVVEAV